MKEPEEFALLVMHLSKSYQIIHSPWKRFAYHVFNAYSGTEFRALDDISFTIKKGETFGIIGTNGSGKSTLLQVISGIIPQTAGTVEVNGKISALLELGSGFNLESTGYENVYMNAAILGVRKETIEQKIAGIIEFADIGAFINEPVKTYSSGMFIRLAFAVAINVDADIIIIDEALAVGDIFFRQKCYAKLNELKEQGKTIVLVSHGMNEVEQFCDRALLLNNGKQILLGKSGDVVAKYYLLNQGECSTEILPNTAETLVKEFGDDSQTFFNGTWRVRERIFFDLSKSEEQSNGAVHYLEVGLFDEQGMAKRVFKQGESAYVYSAVSVERPIEVPISGVVLVNQRNVIVHGKNSAQTDQKLPDMIPAGHTLYSCVKIKLDIEEGEYTFETGCASLPKSVYQMREKMPHEELNQYLTVLADRRSVGVFAIQGKLEPSPSRLKFYGLVDLQDEIDSNVHSTDENGFMSE